MVEAYGTMSPYTSLAVQVVRWAQNYAGLAQMVERMVEDHGVGRSLLSSGTTLNYFEKRLDILEKIDYTSLVVRKEIEVFLLSPPIW